LFLCRGLSSVSRVKSCCSFIFFLLFFCVSSSLYLGDSFLLFFHCFSFCAKQIWFSFFCFLVSFHCFNFSFGFRCYVVSVFVCASSAFDLCLVFSFLFFWFPAGLVVVAPAALFFRWVWRFSSRIRWFMWPWFC
jgi:hypothetical protein